MSAPLVTCPNGHYYNKDHYPQGCPYCKRPAAQGQSETMPLANPAPAPAPMPNGGASPIGATAPNGSAPAMNAAPMQPPMAMGDSNVTMPYIPGYDFQQEHGPAVGWVVCVRGAEKGRSFELHLGYNYFGRERMNDIVLSDPGVSRERHFSICYDPEDHSFSLAMQQGRMPIRCNGQRVDNYKILEYGDIISVESTQLVFVPLCSEKFNWEMYGDGAAK